MCLYIAFEMDTLEVKKWLAYTMVRGNAGETFFLCCFEEERSKVFYSSYKHPLPNIFQGTAFKKHAKMLIKEKSTADFSKLLFFLPSPTDRKENINKFFGKVHFHPIDCSYEDFRNYAFKNSAFSMQHLDSRFLEERETAGEIVSNYLKHVAEISNSNLIRNKNSLMAKGEVKIDPDVEFSWIGKIYPQNQTVFKLGY